MNIQGKATGLGEVLSSSWYVVPIYQRNYSWKVGKKERDSNQVVEFWESIKENHNNNGKTIFLGAIILVREFDRKRNKEVKNVLDGQQRLTTFYILCNAITSEISIFIEQLRKNNINSKIISDFETSKSEFVTWLKKGQYLTFTSNLADNPIIENIFYERDLKTGITELLESHNNLIKAYERLKEEVRREFFEIPINQTNCHLIKNKIDSFYNYLETKAQILPLDVEVAEDAYTLFESMNNTGARLEQEDLLKNHFYKTVHRDHDRITDFWDKLSKFSTINSNFGISDFLLYYHQARHGDIRKDDLFKSLKSIANSQPAILTEIEIMENYADNILLFFNPTKQKFKYTDTVTALNSFEAMNVKMAYLPLMRILEFCDDMKLFKEFVLDLRNIFFVYVKVGKMPTNKLQSFLAKEFCIGMTKANLKDKMSELRNKFYLSKSEFEHQFETFTPANNLSKYLIYEITLKNQNGKFTELSEFDLEHIIPKKLNGEWKEDLTDKKTKKPIIDFYSVDDENIKYIDTIGNHTLWFKDDNRSAQNKGFTYKKNEYKNSAVPMTSDLCKFKSFDYENVKARSETIKKELMKIFKLY